MLSICPKRYVDRSVQTDPEPNVVCGQLSYFGSTRAISSLNSPLEKPQTTVENAAQLGALACEGAYSHSQTSKMGVDALVLLPSRQERKQSTIGCGRPSALVFSAKRITSLPSNSSTGEIFGRLDEQIRIASMPERRKFGALQLPQHPDIAHADTSDSTDITYYAMESVQCIPRRECESERPYPADMPQTPSPPSSPDSVMIIGNEGQVSGSFLRRPSIDDNGWVTWASSPPRPIPALHGPSSLPYARCPSGAEGTLIEGDDLSHKIWGLGIDDTQNSNSRPSKPQINQPVQQHIYLNEHITLQPSGHDGISCGSQTASSQRERDSVIDISRPLTFGNRGNLVGIPPNLVQHSRNTQRGILASGESNKPHLETYSLQNSKLPVNMADPLSNTFGLGLNWNNLSTSEARNPSITSRNTDDSCNRLNSAAPAFVPASAVIDRLQHKAAYMRHVRNTDAPIPQQLDRRSIFLNMAAQYRNQRSYHLPIDTPPSTASPHWSPVFSQPNELEISRKAALKHVQHSSMYQVPKVYSPQLGLEEYASRLSAMVEQLGGHSLDLNVQRFSPVHQFPAQQTELPVLQIQSKKAAEYTKPSISNDNGFMDKLSDSQQVVSEQEMEPSNDSMDVNNLLFSSERRRNLSYQHPRSIPLARLIQRRLSSVVEEDAGRDSLLPLLRKKVSDFTFNRLSQGVSNLRRPSGGGSRLQYPSDDEHFEYTMGDEENIESAVNMEDPPTENANAIVKLPQKPAVLHENRASNGFGHMRSTKNEVGKENDNGWDVPSGELMAHGKPKNKHRRKADSTSNKHSSQV